MSDRRTAEVPIYKGGDLQRLSELRQAADVADRLHQQAIKSGTLRGGDAGAQAEKAAYDAFVAEAADRAEIVKLRALGRKQWRALLDEHPPRRVPRLIDGAQTEVVHDDDEEFGVNTATFSEALLAYIDPNREDMRTIIEPEFPTKAALTDWLDDISGGDFDRLFLTAFTLNGSVGYDPKETVYSPTSPTSSETSA